MRRRGTPAGWRRTQLEEKDYVLVETLARAGATKATIAAKLGISISTLESWIRAGRDGDERHVELVRRLRAAEADFEQVLLGVIKMAGAVGDWKAAAWLLEKRFPTRFGERRKLVVHSTDQDADAAIYRLGPWAESTRDPTDRES